METLCRALIDSIQSDLLLEVEALPWNPRELETTINLSGFLVYLFRELIGDNCDESSRRESQIAFTLIICGRNELEEGPFTERYFTGYYLTAALMMIEDANSEMDEKRYPVSLLLCNSAQQFLGRIEGFRTARETGADSYCKQASRKATDAKYLPGRQLYQEAFEVAREMWQTGSQLKHTEMMRFLTEEYKGKTSPFRKFDPNCGFTEKGLRNHLKSLLEQIGRSDLIVGRKN